MPKRTSISTVFFDLFSLIFGPKTDAPDPKNIENLFVLQYLVEIRLFKLMAVLGPKIREKRSKKTVEIEVRFGIDFWSILVRCWEGFGS
jgi:hypothetical protein